MAVASLVPDSTEPVSQGPTAVLVSFNFTRGAGSTSTTENYRILENGEARLIEVSEEVLQLED